MTELDPNINCKIEYPETVRNIIRGKKYAVMFFEKMSSNHYNDRMLFKNLEFLLLFAYRNFEFIYVI